MDLADCRIAGRRGRHDATALRSPALDPQIDLDSTRTETTPMHRPLPARPDPSRRRRRTRLALAAAVGAAGAALALSLSAVAHGNVTPQAVDTTGLQALGDGWREENPYSANSLAISIGASGFNQNCARCHGLEAISGGIAPDLRKLDNDCATMKDDAKRHACVLEIDQYFIDTVRHGRTRNGAVYMPPFEGVLTQEALWAIKSWLETRREKPVADAR
jgi:cytochrome c-550 PedF